MLTGDHNDLSSRSRNRRIRLLLLATAGAVLLGDVAGAERAAGVADSAHGRASAGISAASIPAAPATLTRVPLHVTPGTVATPTTVAKVTTTTAARPPVHVAAPTVPSRGVQAVANTPAPSPQTLPATPATPAAAPSIAPSVAPRPAPAPAPAPAPRPAPAPAPRPAPAPAPAPARPPATTNPPASIPPDQAFEQACWTSNPNTQACDQAALVDINHARAQEGLGPLALPSNYYSLSVPAQLVAVANAERTSRGLPAMPEKSSLDPLAQQGAASGRDPSGPSGTTWDSNWVLGDPTVLSADFSWMYDDGPGSQNIDCTASNTSGCWGHRVNILSPWAGSAGAAVATYQGRVSMAEVFVKNA